MIRDKLLIFMDNQAVDTAATSTLSDNVIDMNLGEDYFTGDPLVPDAGNSKLWLHVLVGDTDIAPNTMGTVDVKIMHSDTGADGSFTELQSFQNKVTPYANGRLRGGYQIGRGILTTDHKQYLMVQLDFATQPTAGTVNAFLSTHP